MRMLTTPHALIGALLMLKMNNPFLGILMAFLSHFIFDFFIPHWNPHIYTEYSKSKSISKNSLIIIITDVVVANLSLAAVAYFTNASLMQVILIWTGAFFAILPDLVEAPYYFFNYSNKLMDKYVQFEHNYQADGNIFWGLLTQIITLGATVLSFINL